MLAVGFEAFIAAVGLLGVAVAVWWRKVRPERYDQLGSFLG